MIADAASVFAADELRLVGAPCTGVGAVFARRHRAWCCGRCRPSSTRAWLIGSARDVMFFAADELPLRRVCYYGRRTGRLCALCFERDGAARDHHPARRGVVRARRGVGFRRWPRARADVTFLGVFWTAPTRRGAWFDSWTARVALLARVSWGIAIASVRRRPL